MADKNKTWLFEITAWQPPDPTATNRWGSNLTVHIVTDTAEGAIELFRADHADAVINKVEKRNRTGQGVIVDPRFGSASSS